MTTFARVRSTGGSLRPVRVSQRLSKRDQSAFPDQTPPAIFNLYPANGATGVPVDGYISFTMLDNIQIDIATFQSFIDGYQVVLNGQLQDGYGGSITTAGTGYDVVIDPDVNWDGYSTVISSVSVSDTSANQSNILWSFITV